MLIFCSKLSNSVTLSLLDTFLEILFFPALLIFVKFSSIDMLSFKFIPSAIVLIKAIYFFLPSFICFYSLISSIRETRHDLKITYLSSSFIFLMTNNMVLMSDKSLGFLFIIGWVGWASSKASKILRERALI